jgi:hypothetical protein
MLVHNTDLGGKIDYTYKVMFYDLLKYHQNFREIAPSLQAVGTVFALSLSLSNTHRLTNPAPFGQ